MNPFNLKQGDFVVLKDGYIYQILCNPLAFKTGLSLFSNQYSCLAHVDDYAENFDCVYTDCFNIYAVMCYEFDSDEFKTVAQHFVAGTRLTDSIMESLEWDWKREKDRLSFEKTNLVHGAVVTTREGNVYMVSLGIKTRKDKVDALISTHGYEDLSFYNEDMTYKFTNEKDIVRVEFFNDFSVPNDRYLIWQREEEK